MDIIILKKGLKRRKPSLLLEKIGGQMDVSMRIGVDLNRNYPFDWNDKAGSSSNPCEEDWGGPSPFSEPETRALRDFIEQNKNEIGLVINFHAYGNLWIYPYACCKEDQELKSTRIKSIYSEFKSKALFPAQAKVGNAWETIQYLASGDASDWILKTYDIVALSPELGITSPQSETFFPRKEFLYGFVQQDYPPIWYMISKMNSQIDALKAEVKNDSQTNTTRFSQNFINKSFKNIKDCEFLVTIKPLCPEAFLKLPRVIMTYSDIDGQNTTIVNDLSLHQLIEKDNYNILTWSYTVDFESWKQANITISFFNNQQKYEELDVEIKITDLSKSYFQKTYGKSALPMIKIHRDIIPIIAGIFIALALMIFFRGLYSKYKNYSGLSMQEVRTQDDDNFVEVVTFSSEQKDKNLLLSSI